MAGSFLTSSRLEGRRLDDKTDLGVRVALLLVEETVEMTDGGAFLWVDEEEDDCFECRRRVPPREGIVGYSSVEWRHKKVLGVRECQLASQRW